MFIEFPVYVATIDPDQQVWMRVNPHLVRMAYCRRVHPAGRLRGQQAREVELIMIDASSVISRPLTVQEAEELAGRFDHVEPPHEMQIEIAKMYGSSTVRNLNF